MKKNNTDYEKHKENYNIISYLEELSESYIFKTYKEALLSDDESPFPDDISQENRDMFYRLKFRALNYAR